MRNDANNIAGKSLNLNDQNKFYFIGGGWSEPKYKLKREDNMTDDTAPNPRQF